MRRRSTYLALTCLLLPVAAGAALLKPPKAGMEITQSAAAFLETLSEEQQAQATKDLKDASRFDWHYIPKKFRKGVQLREMNAAQRKAAHALLASCLSDVGYKKAKTIMELEAILNKLEGSAAKFRRDPLRYYVTVFGKPAAEGRWALSLEGHHLSLNFVIEDGRLVAHTPAMFGANPAVVKANYGVGPGKGTRVLAAEEQLAFKLLHALSADQRKTAIIAEKAPADVRDAGSKHPPQDKPEGIAASELNDAQLKVLRSLIAANAENMRGERSEAEIAAIEKAGIGKVHFAWAGALEEGVGHYYRLQGPTFLVEFCNTQPDTAGNPANHIHVFWRNMAGDFGEPVVLKRH